MMPHSSAVHESAVHEGVHAPDSPVVLIVEGNEGPARRRWIESRAEEIAGGRDHKFILTCRFDLGGPWAGVSDLFLSLLPDIRARRPDLFIRHGAELVHILPRLQQELTVQNLNLTDLANAEEKVRNWAADRAFRNVHGLIDLLTEWNTASGADAPWTIAWDGYDRAGKMCANFFKELLRRGQSLRPRFIVAVGPGKAEEVCAALDAAIPRRVVKMDFAVESIPAPDGAAAEQMAEALEQQVGKDPVESRVQLPELIRRWTLAGRPDKVVRWRYYGLAVYLHLGLYEDALLYGRGLLALARECAPSDLHFQLWIVIKILNGQTAIQDAPAALKFIHEEAASVIAQAPVGFRGDLLYLIAMVYARYAKPRDFAKGEEYLDLALEAIEQSRLPLDQLCFQRVFNRNGVAMIRNFQGRHEEAIELCHKGLEQLDLHVPREQHRLHRSILTYNIAQVYNAMGQLEKAVEYYSAVMEMDPNYSEYYNERGSIYLKMGMLEESLADYHKATELSPPYFEVFVNIGQCCREMGSLEEAIRHYSRALDLRPDLPLALLGRAQASGALGRQQDAIRDYSTALALDPNQWEAFAGRGIAHYEAGHPDLALADLNAAIGLEPRNPDLYQNRATALAEAGRFSEAVVDLETALSLNPSEPDKRDVQDKLETMRRKAS